MKKIKLNGKLSLNKETITKLNDDQMNGVKGGGFMSITAGCTQIQGKCGCKGKVSKGLFCA